MTRPTVSVVIPTRDKADSLRLVLTCLARQVCPEPHEIVVVDDGCTDGTADVVAAAAARLPVRTVAGPRAGRAAARNAGAAAARGGLLLFLDDDILLPPAALAAHVTEHGGSEPACVHGPVRELPGARRLLATEPGELLPDPHAAATSGRFGRTVANALETLVTRMAEGELEPVAPWLTCIGANTSMPYGLWERSGGYDETFGTTWGCEDLELGLRLWSAGAGMRLAPAAPGVHLTHERADRWEQHTVNLTRFTQKHPVPAVRALPELLGPAGNTRRYVTAVRILEESALP
ncbi:glycosyltransferase family 2 protein [Streptomyces phaeoluteigriseus]|uniref:Glycosyltransferase family 2 protein n=1 Tax=Streptomyces phaeoluteigriseus TaxID=114686 RepID=A0ABY4ZB57_9ACTN|nr:glycosyltransferase family 2 protein [Streptomyces phaeoluteigriseus]USQ86279.1 glycosyltransferase family 2 protein [Streptomyces phaeoluteigriseus]